MGGNNMNNGVLPSMRYRDMSEKLHEEFRGAGENACISLSKDASVLCVRSGTPKLDISNQKFKEEAQEAADARDILKAAINNDFGAWFPGGKPGDLIFRHLGLDNSPTPLGERELNNIDHELQRELAMAADLKDAEPSHAPIAQVQNVRVPGLAPSVHPLPERAGPSLREATGANARLRDALVKDLEAAPNIRDAQRAAEAILNSLAPVRGASSRDFVDKVAQHLDEHSISSTSVRELGDEIDLNANIAVLNASIAVNVDDLRNVNGQVRTLLDKHPFQENSSLRSILARNEDALAAVEGLKKQGISDGKGRHDLFLQMEDSLQWLVQAGALIGDGDRKAGVPAGHLQALLETQIAAMHDLTLAVLNPRMRDDVRVAGGILSANDDGADRLQNIETALLEVQLKAPANLFLSRAVESNGQGALAARNGRYNHALELAVRAHKAYTNDPSTMNLKALDLALAKAGALNDRLMMQYGPAKLLSREMAKRRSFDPQYDLLCQQRLSLQALKIGVTQAMARLLTAPAASGDELPPDGHASAVREHSGAVHARPVDVQIPNEKSVPADDEEENDQSVIDEMEAEYRQGGDLGPRINLNPLRRAEHGN